MEVTAGIRLERAGRKPSLGDWDFDGSWVNATTFPHATASVGVFQWIARASKKGLKRGRSVIRFHSTFDDGEGIFARAEAFCREQESKV